MPVGYEPYPGSKLRSSSGLIKTLTAGSPVELEKKSKLKKHDINRCLLKCVFLKDANFGLSPRTLVLFFNYSFFLLFFLNVCISLSIQGTYFLLRFCGFYIFYIVFILSFSRTVS